MLKGAVLRYLVSDALSLTGNSIAGVVLPLVLLARTGDALAAGLHALNPTRRLWVGYREHRIPSWFGRSFWTAYSSSLPTRLSRAFCGPSHSPLRRT